VCGLVLESYDFFVLDMGQRLAVTMAFSFGGSIHEVYANSFCKQAGRSRATAWHLGGPATAGANLPGWDLRVRPDAPWPNRYAIRGVQSKRRQRRLWKHELRARRTRGLKIRLS